MKSSAAKTSTRSLENEAIPGRENVMGLLIAGSPNREVAKI